MLLATSLLGLYDDQVPYCSHGGALHFGFATSGTLSINLADSHPYSRHLTTNWIDPVAGLTWFRYADVARGVDPTSSARRDGEEENESSESHWDSYPVAVVGAPASPR